MCPVDLPVAFCPSWQEAQPVVIPVWSIPAPEKVVVDLWQVSQGSLVWTWPPGLPTAVWPLWHDAQFVVMPLCTNWAPANVDVVL